MLVLYIKPRAQDGTRTGESDCRCGGGERKKSHWQGFELEETDCAKPIDSTWLPTSTTIQVISDLSADKCPYHFQVTVELAAVQSLKRCMYATEEMIREGKKALDYHVRVSDVKLGGRVLSSHEDDDKTGREIEVDDELSAEDPAKGFLDVWSNVGRPSFEGSEGGDRDSGIEVDRPSIASLSFGHKSSSALDSGRPPGEALAGAASLS